MAMNEQALENASQATIPIIMVVANDLKLLKLLEMALSLELACEVLTLDSGRSAETAAKQVTPDLLILDEYLLDRNARELDAHLHSIIGLELMPTLLINTSASSQSQDYPTLFLSTSWKMESLYVAVHELLSHIS